MHELTLGDVDRGHDPAVWRWDLDGRLVRLDFHQRLVLADDVAFLDVEAHDLSLVNALAEVREREVDAAHCQATVSCAARTISSLSGRKCCSTWK